MGHFARARPCGSGSPCCLCFAISSLASVVSEEEQTKGWIGWLAAALIVYTAFWIVYLPRAHFPEDTRPAIYWAFAMAPALLGMMAPVLGGGEWVTGPGVIVSVVLLWRTSKLIRRSAVRGGATAWSRRLARRARIVPDRHFGATGHPCRSQGPRPTFSKLVLQLLHRPMSIAVGAFPKTGLYRWRLVPTVTCQTVSKSAPHTGQLRSTIRRSCHSDERYASDSGTSRLGTGHVRRPHLARDESIGFCRTS